MELLVDIGNSRTKWCDRERLSKGDVSTSYNDCLQGMLENEWRLLARPESVWISSVASENVLTTLISWLEDTWSMSPVFARSYPEQLGVVNGYAKPDQLGVDRWLSLIAARALFNRALIVVDCGTATTIDALDQDGRHLGGLILPGPRTMQECLLKKTAIPESGESSIIGYFSQDTATGISSGAALSTICLIERIAETLKERVGGDIHCVLTGGGADEIKDTLNMSFYHEPNLVLQGLSLVTREDHA